MVNVTMGTHSINLKEVESAIYRKETNQTPYLSMGTGGMIQGSLQVVKTNLNIGGRRRRHGMTRKYE